MNNEFIKVLDELSKRFGVAIDWTQQNIMPQLQILSGKFVAYTFWTDIFWLIVSLAILIPIIKYTTWFIKHENDYDLSSQFGPMVGFGISCILFIAAIISIFVCITEIITILTFPEKVIFDYLRNLR